MLLVRSIREDRSALHRTVVVKVVQVEQTDDMRNSAANFFWRFVTDAWNYLVRSVSCHDLALSSISLQAAGNLYICAGLH
jgi:hypothetical protein